MTQSDVTQRLRELANAFSPFAPIKMKDLFRGRYEQVERACEVIAEPGQHFVIYGERGVGKTSLANILNTVLGNVVVSKVTCNREESFRDMWNKALSQVHFHKMKDSAGFVPAKIVEPVQLNLFLPEREDIEPIDVQGVLERVSRHLLFIFDEFDSITDARVRANFADTIKALSDNAQHVTIGIVGIAENVPELIGEHLSIERCVAQMLLPKMAPAELREVLEKGLNLVELRMEPAVTQSIIELSSGFPHFTHLLGKFACRIAIEEGAKIVSETHYRLALSAALRNTNESVRAVYQKATIASKHSRFSAVVAACALAETDEFGTFATRDVPRPYYEVTGEKVKTQNVAYNLQRLTTTERGPLLCRIGEPRNYRYRFVNPMVKVFVRMRLEQEGTFTQPKLV